MNNELTEVDIKKMQQEIDYRILELRPQLIKDVQFARSYGDLSENFEYKEAKRQKNRNESRIRYLQKMIRTATIVKPTEGEGITLFDKLTLRDEDGDEMAVQLVTTLRVNADKGLISPESPLGKALIGHKAGDTVTVQVRDDFSYEVTVLTVEKGEDDESLPIAQY